MNPEFPQNEREKLEAKLTALLLGELSAHEAAALHRAMEEDPDLAALYDQLKLTIHLVREGAATPASETAPKPAPLKLSADRREKLLAQFKTITPKEFAQPPRRGIRLLELVAVVAIIAMLAALLLPALLRPNSALRIPVRVGGLAPGEQARMVVAAVDVGILNLTGYKPPAPDDYYLGQRRLTAEIRDLYGQLIDGMQGARGQIKTGGDGGAELQGPPPTQKLLALYSGIVEVKPDGTAEVTFDVPDFAGTARVMFAQRKRLGQPGVVGTILRVAVMGADCEGAGSASVLGECLQRRGNCQQQGQSNEFSEHEVVL